MARDLQTIYGPRYVFSSRSVRGMKDAIGFASAHQMRGIDWNLDYMRLPLSSAALEQYYQAIVESGPAFSFHAPSIDVELSLRDEDRADLSRRYLQMYIDILSVFGPTTLTVHMAGKSIPLHEVSVEQGIRNLRRIVEYGGARNVTVCLENLKHGWTGDPYELRRISMESGAMITFDVGHCSASPWVRDLKKTQVEFLDIIADRVVASHVYEIETPAGEHVPPTDLNRIGPVLDRLLEIGCTWWVIELATPEEVASTLEVLKNGAPARGWPIPA